MRDKKQSRQGWYARHYVSGQLGGGVISVHQGGANHPKTKTKTTTEKTKTKTDSTKTRGSSEWTGEGRAIQVKFQQLSSVPNIYLLISSKLTILAKRFVHHRASKVGQQGVPKKHFFKIELSSLNHPCHWVIGGHKKISALQTVK